MFLVGIFQPTFQNSKSPLLFQKIFTELLINAIKEKAGYVETTILSMMSDGQMEFSKFFESFPIAIT